MADESEISDYFQSRQSKEGYHQLMGHFFYKHALKFKQILLFTMFGDDRKSEFKMAVV